MYGVMAWRGEVVESPRIWAFLGMLLELLVMPSILDWADMQSVAEFQWASKAVGVSWWVGHTRKSGSNALPLLAARQ